MIISACPLTSGMYNVGLWKELEMRRRTAIGAIVGTVLATVSVLAGPGGPSPAAANGREPIPLVYDSDLDFDDATTLAYLCQEHKQGRVDLRAVTINNNGVGVKDRAVTHAKSILEQCGLPKIPIADGSDVGRNPAPPEGKEIWETVLTNALDDADRPVPPTPVPAHLLIAAVALASETPVTVLTTGPLSNLAKAVEFPGVARKIGQLHVMGGAFDVPGNLWGSTAAGFDNTQEFNIWLDSAAAAKVFRKVPHARIVPLDATQDVPITLDYIDRLGATAETAEARLVHSIMSQPEVTDFVEVGALFWWDALAVTSMTRGPGIVDYQRRVIDVVEGGESDGRTHDTRAGTPHWVGSGASRELFERTFIDVLNGR